MSADKMRVHVAEFEHWHGQCVRREAAARAHVRHQLAQRDGAQDEDYAVMAWLDEDDLYRRLASKRNGHQQAALMYALAALVERGAPA